VGGTRWWNVKHPAAYAARLAEGTTPAYAREVLDDDVRRMERIMLELRLADGCPLDLLDLQTVEGQIAEGQLDDQAYERGRAVPTLRGRLLADAVVRALT
jgi:oxygen-independent coproporphyrinogen-3 oxidase